MGAPLRCGAWASHCGGFSCCGAQALGAQASVVVAHGLSCSGMWDFPGLGLEPTSPALAGGFFTTAPPGKPTKGILKLSLEKINQGNLTKMEWETRRGALMHVPLTSIQILTGETTLHLQTEVTLLYCCLWEEDILLAWQQPSQ